MATTAAQNWITHANSQYPWERDALDFVRARFPNYEPYRAWSNFEFIADDGSINEVDLLVFTPQGLFLIEIKSRRGRLLGDAGTWTWEMDGKLTTTDSPLIAANLKAKKLRALLGRQKACQKKGPLPFIEALVFCSDPDLKLDLQGNARLRVCLRDRDASDDTPARPGIMAALMRRECPGLEATAKGKHDRPTGKMVSQAIEQAGIRPSQRQRKVSDYLLEQLLGEGPNYQDWQARHVQIAESLRRVRLYMVRTGATEEDRQIAARAAKREYQLMETLVHPGVLRAHGFTEHEVGPALIFEHDPLSIRLDHYLVQQKGKLDIDGQLGLLRQIADCIRYAHDKKIVHRALSPQSILVSEPGTPRQQIKVFNWQVGYRDAGSSTGSGRAVSATSHVDRLVEDASTAYMAPEALAEENTGEHLDVFSLGAIAYHLFSGVPPAINGLELDKKLRETKGLQISAVLNGAADALQYLIQYSTHPNVPDRTDSVADFLYYLDEVEKELTTPEHEVDDPSRAQLGDLLPGGYKVVRRIGQGAATVAFLVEKDGQHFVLKAASEAEQNARVNEEADVLRKQELRHPCLVEFVESLEIGRHAAFLMRPVFRDKDKKDIETLGRRLRKEGRLHIDMLQRFGEDLLSAVNHLEEQGIPHRDIKPDNIAVGKVGRGDKLHLVLFDFSLSRTPPDNIRAGTKGYVDPFLPSRAPKPRWDLYAERYAAAATLYEMATGTLPTWGDGATDPSHLSDDTEVTLDSEMFDASLRDHLSGFFQKALRRNIGERFHNAEEMLRAWRKLFEGIEEPGKRSDDAGQTELRELLSVATFDTQIAELGLGTRATNALDRANILTVEDLLTASMRRLLRLRGVGNTTRRQIAAAVKMLRERLGSPSRENAPLAEEAEAETLDITALSVDLLLNRILKAASRESQTVRDAMRAVLGLGFATFAETGAELPIENRENAKSKIRNLESEIDWPNQADVARFLNVTRARVGQILGKLQTKWSKDSAITHFRAQIVETLDIHGGVMSMSELVAAMLLARGSAQDDPGRSRTAAAAVRAAIEAERGTMEPRLLLRRDGSRFLVARGAELAAYGLRLGDQADRMADEDPLVAPSRVIERLRDVAAPAGVALPDARLLRFAAAASTHAVLSGRQELYPHRMPAARALRLSQGAVMGVRTLSVEQLQERVSSRYPEAEPLCVRPALDNLLAECGFDLHWDATGGNGIGCYVSPLRNVTSVTSGSFPPPRQPTAPGELPPGEITPEVADARAFEERLRRAVKDGSFLALLVDPKSYEQAADELSRRFPVQLVDCEGLFIDALRGAAQQAKVNWEAVIKTDAAPKGGDWDKLMRLVGRAMPSVEQQFMTADKTILLIYPGLLARYERMDLLERLRDQVGRRDGIPGLWLLVPGDHQALLDGKPVPLISAGQRARIPESWIGNEHRGRG